MAVLLISAGHTVSIFALFAKVGGEKKRVVLGMQVGRAVAGMFGQVCLVSWDGERRLDVHRGLIFIPLSQCQHKCYSRGVQGLGRQPLSGSFHRMTTPHGRIAWHPVSPLPLLLE